MTDPTLGYSKKQLTYRIAFWGLQKNVKQGERRSVINGLKNHELDAAEFERRELRGRRLDKAKLERWMRKESASTIPVGPEDEITCLNERSSKSL